MNDHIDIDDALGELRTALALEPAHDFAARVRRHVRAAPARSWWLQPRWIVAGAAVAAVVVAIAVSLSPRHGVSQPSGVVVAAAPVLATPSAAIPPVPQKDIVVRARHDSDVLIPAAEIDAMRNLLRSIEAGALEVPPDTPLETDSEGRVKPLEIPTITIAPLNPPVVAGEAKGIGS